MAVAAGAEAPDFALKDQHGADVRASDFRGRENLLVVFYPYAFTGVCTGELRELQEELAAFEKLDTAVVAISCDTMFALRVFADREGLEFPLLSDFWPHGAVARAYGVFDDERGCAVRGSFVVDRTGIVRWSVVNAIPDARDIGDHLEATERLRA